MFKRVISLCIATIMLSTSFFNIVFAENEIDDAIPIDAVIENIGDGSQENISIEEKINPPTSDGDLSIDISPSVDNVESNDSVELSSYTVYWCPRRVMCYGTRSNPVMFYRGAESTSYYDAGWDKYTFETSLYCIGYTYSTITGYRYIADIPSSDNGPYAGQTIRFYLPFNANNVALTDIYHDYGSASSSHPHRRYCDCGDSYTTTNSSCYSCYPGYIYYYNNGGSGAPSTQTVTSSSAYVSSTLPTRFKYKFRGWDTSSSASSGSYYPGDSISVSANSSKSLYAIWESYYTLSGNSYFDSTRIRIGGTMGYFKFTPSESGTYVFQSTNSSGDTYGYLYNSSGSQLTSNDDSGDGSNFKISYYLTGGTTYYYGVKWYGSSTTGYIYVDLRRQYDISYNANGGSGAPSSQTKLHGNSLTLSGTKPVRNLWQFNGWATSSTATSAQYQAGGSYSGNGNQTLYAVWGYPTGSCGTNATWTFSPDDKSLTISGTGAMNDYSATSTAPWNAYIDNIDTINIADGITSIGNYAFSGCKNVTSLNLPSSVTDIGEYAFSGCSALTTINIPSGVTAIEKYTFNNCAALTAPELPETVTSIGEYAFFGCSSITAMNLPASVTAIGTYAFSGCSNMESINIPSGVTAIEAYTFNGNTKLNAIVIPDTVKVIKEFAFSDCSSIPSVIIPKSVTEIQRGAFSNCSALTSVTIPDSVSTIGTSIFAYIKDNVTIKCYLDTAAYKYATDNEIAYELMSWGTLENITFTKTAIQGGIMVSIIAPKGTIYYTTNGTEPTTSSTVYTGPITAKKNMTIKAIAVADGWDDSAVAEFYTDIQKVSTPYASAVSGRVVSGTKVELYCETEGAEIWCTTDGNIPTESDIYTGEIEITENITIYAVAVKDGMLNSGLATFNYELSAAEDTPLVTTLEATDITETSAKLSASVDDNNGVLRMVEFIYYEKNNSSVKYNITADASYNAVVTGLTPNTEYWYQARALNELGWTMGYIESFTTDAQGVIKPTSIEIEPSYLSMNVGKKKTLLATILPAVADNRDVYWSSEDSSVATIDENGTVTAVGLGNTRIKATTVSNRLVAYCNIDVISSDVRGEFDFSEHHMITNSSYYDEYGFDHGPSDGGNALMASAYLARWDGAVLEENDVYPYPSKENNIKYNGTVSSDYHVQNVIYLPYRNGDLDNNEIKNAIMKYGAVYSSFKIRQDVVDGKFVNRYFNENSSTYYFPQNAPTNPNAGHAITIVGWDDNYPRVNFDVTPPADGAFICKNSWGTDSGEKGYFYISYYDKYLGKYDSTVGQTDYNAVFYNVESKDNYNKIYQYDYLGPVIATDNFKVKSLYSANVFPEAGNTLQEKELLKAVSFYNYSPGMPYEIYIVTNYQDADSLKKLGSPIKTGVTEYAGYLTVNLDNPIELASGTRFAVVVKCTAKSGHVKVFVEMPLDKHASNAKANKDESYIGMDKKTWMDLTNPLPNTNLCIKAFTQTDDNSILLQGIDNVNREYESDKVYTIDELVEKGYEFNNAFIEYIKNNDSIELFTSEESYNLGAIPPSFIPDLNTNNNYSEGASLPSKYDLREEECMTSVKNQGEIGSCWAFATYSSLESCLKKASFLSRGSSNDGLNQSTSNASSIVLDTTGTQMALGNSIQLKATILPIDSTAELVWESSNSSIVSVSSRGIVTALGVGNATITVSTATGETSAQCAITVTAPVSVDSITINNTESQIVAGNKLLLDYSVYPENAGDKNIIWEVDDSSIASVNEYGLLTAKGGGTVTITAYSADRSVSDTYTLSIDDGFDCNIEITENNLGVYDTNIFGSISVNVTNKTNDTIDGSVTMAIYDSVGKMVKVLSEDKELAVGDNPIEFKNIYVSGLTDKKFKVKIFAWDSMQKLKPISIAKEETVE